MQGCDGLGWMDRVVKEEGRDDVRMQSLESMEESGQWQIYLERIIASLNAYECN